MRTAAGETRMALDEPLQFEAHLFETAADLFIARRFAEGRESLNANVDPRRIRAEALRRPGDDPPFLPKGVKADGGIRPETRAFVYERDRYACRYCGRLLLDKWTIALVATIAGIEVLPWRDNGFHMGMEYTAPACERLMPNADHRIPHSRVGGFSDPPNLRTCCTICNELKGHCTPEELGWHDKEPPTGWNGLVDRVADLRHALRALNGADV